MKQKINANLFQHLKKQILNLNNIFQGYKILSQVRKVYLQYLNNPLQVRKSIKYLIDKKQELKKQYNLAAYYLEQILEDFKNGFGGYEYCIKDCQPFIQQNKVNDIQHSIFKDLLNCGYVDCICCQQRLIKSFPFPQTQLSKPVILVNLKTISYQDMRQIICSIANSQQGCGSIIAVQQFNNNIIKKGITKFDQNDITILQNKITQAVKSITYQQNIKIKAESLPLISLHQLLSIQKDHSQYVIRINVGTRYSINPLEYKKNLFFIQHRIKKQYKPYYIFGKIFFNNDDHLYKTRKLISEQIYPEILFDYFRQKYKLLIRQKCQQFDSKQISMKIKKIGQNNKFGFNSTNTKGHSFNISIKPDEFVYSCCKIFWQNHYENQIPQIKQNQTIMALSINQRYEVIQTIRKFQQIFKAQKIKYQLIIPCYDLQRTLSALRKQQNPKIATYLTVIFIFQGKYGHFKQKFNQKYKSKLDQAVIIEVVTEKISLGMMLSQSQYNWYNQLIYQKYTILPLIKKNIFSKQNQISYKNIEIKFDKIDRNASLYTYLFCQFIRKRPKCNI